MDVTPEIQRIHQLYGSSDNTSPGHLSSSKSLNYAAGPSITRPEDVQISLIPFTLKYQGEVGLFGAENYFVRVKVKVDREYVDACYEEPYWECAIIREGTDSDPYYVGAQIDYDADRVTVNTYDPAQINEALSQRFDAYISVNLDNLKTGNIYIDSWLDVSLYNSHREEHMFNEMFVRENDVFYVGFHARNTRRLAYNVNCIIGTDYISELDMSDEQRKLIART